jgi:carbamoyl-phosphate synthase/aspartate carbamoyltransferase/dihydroorotase
MPTIRIPGLIDPHVHLREPGGTHKEDFDSGTAAALAGGFTAVLAMPNTAPPLTDASSLDLALTSAREKARCDYGLFLGAGGDNLERASALAGRCCGLKLYLDQTFGPLKLDGLDQVMQHLQRWPARRPVAAHAEGRSLALVLLLAGLLDRPVHVCHVSQAAEIRLIRLAKQRGFPVTCEVAPHHLFLVEGDLAGGRAVVRPPLATTQDREALWENLAVIDCFATDHAPHTLAEKDGPNPPPGFPGLETALALLMGAVRQGRMTMDDLLARCHTNPRRIFGLPEQPETWVEVDPEAAWQARAAELHSRCAWTPFEGMRLHGRVRRVQLRGALAYDDGRVLAAPGHGRNLMVEHQPIPG